MPKQRGLRISRYGTSNWLINGLLHGKNENITNIHREFTNNFLKIMFHEISPKSLSKGFLLILKFSERRPKTHREFPGK